MLNLYVARDRQLQKYQFNAAKSDFFKTTTKHSYGLSNDDHKTIVDYFR